MLYHGVKAHRGVFDSRECRFCVQYACPVMSTSVVKGGTRLVHSMCSSLFPCPFGKIKSSRQVTHSVDKLGGAVSQGMCGWKKLALGSHESASGNHTVTLMLYLKFLLANLLTVVKLP